MANQTAIRAQTQPGEEIMAHEDSHIYHYEGGAPAVLSGCLLRLLPGARGMFDAEAVRRSIRPDDVHFTRSSLIVVENTHNRGGGTCWSLNDATELRKVADEFGLRMHLDGARLMNACAAKGYRPAEFGRSFDTVSICFSKGLGAPVGSAVAGSAETIHRVRRFRKMFGGGMRQVGIIAAGAIHALEHHVERLNEDHVHARKLAEAISSMDGLSIDLASVETNIVYFNVDESRSSAEALCASLRKHNVWMLPIGPQRARAVLHLDVSDEGVDRTIEALASSLTKF